MTSARRSARRPRTARGSDTAGSGRPTDVQVWVDRADTSTLAGRLFVHRQGRTESASFVYDSRWLSDDDAYALDPGLPLVSGTLQTPTNQKLFGALADSCPDRWGRRLIDRTEKHEARATGRTPLSFGEFDLLVRVRDDLRQGSIRFRRGEQYVEHAALGAMWHAEPTPTGIVC